jgi:hypothetical protein
MDDLTGRIGLVQGGQDFWARAIVAATGSPFHHVIVATDNEHCMSADWPTAQLVPLKQFAGQITWLDVDATDKQRRDAAWHALALDGTPYNRVSFALAGAHAIGIPTPRALSTWVRRYGDDCVMLACAVYAAVGIHLLDDPVTASPGDLAKVGKLQPHTPDADSTTQTL